MSGLFIMACSFITLGRPGLLLPTQKWALTYNSPIKKKKKKKEPPYWHFAHRLIYQDTQGCGFNEAVIISHTCQGSCGWPGKLYPHSIQQSFRQVLLSSKSRNPQIAGLRVGNAAWYGLNLTCVLGLKLTRPGPTLGCCSEGCDTLKRWDPDSGSRCRGAGL